MVHGRAVYGGALPDEVLRSIRSSEAMIGFTTRRDPAGQDSFYTHPWVVQELVAAHSQLPRIPFVEVREEGVLSPGGIIEAADNQRIDYGEADRAACLVKIADALRRFREQTKVISVRLGPGTMVDQVNEYLDDPSFVCRVQKLRGAVESPPEPIPVFPIGGGLFVQLRGILPGELVLTCINRS